MDRARLSDEEIAQRLPALEGFRREGDKLVADFKFQDFVGAFAFMTSLALVAERLDHHPEWTNVYNRVHIELTTHDSKGITLLDVTFATKAIEFFRRT